MAQARSPTMSQACRYLFSIAAGAHYHELASVSDDRPEPFGQ